MSSLSWRDKTLGKRREMYEMNAQTRLTTAGWALHVYKRGRERERGQEMYRESLHQKQT